MLAWIKLGTAFVILGIILISLYHALRKCRSNYNDAPAGPPEMELHGVNIVGNSEGGASV